MCTYHIIQLGCKCEYLNGKKKECPNPHTHKGYPRGICCAYRPIINKTVPVICEDHIADKDAPIVVVWDPLRDKLSGCHGPGKGRRLAARPADTLHKLGFKRPREEVEEDERLEKPTGLLDPAKLPAMIDERVAKGFRRSARTRKETRKFGEKLKVAEKVLAKTSEGLSEIKEQLEEKGEKLSDFNANVRELQAAESLIRLSAGLPVVPNEEDTEMVDADNAMAQGAGQSVEMDERSRRAKRKRSMINAGNATALGDDQLAGQPNATDDMPPRPPKRRRSSAPEPNPEAALQGSGSSPTIKSDSGQEIRKSPRLTLKLNSKSPDTPQPTTPPDAGLSTPKSTSSKKTKGSSGDSTTSRKSQRLKLNGPKPSPPSSNERILLKLRKTPSPNQIQIQNNSFATTNNTATDVASSATINTTDITPFDTTTPPLTPRPSPSPPHHSSQP